MAGIVTARLRAQRLVGNGFASAVDVVRHFGAVQSQDYPGAKWALALRMRSAVESDIDRAFDAGAIVRTHVLRPTWHFVAPEDVRWMLALTGPKVHRGMAGRHRELGLDAPTIASAHRVFEKALEGGNQLTRPEVGAALEHAGIAVDPHRLPHLLYSGELTALLISGRRKHGQHTYALFEERVPKSPPLDREEAIARLAHLYFMSHGPAQLRDFVWWSGLTLAEARRGIASSADSLDHVEVDGATYWFDAALGAARLPAATAILLPNFDEYTVGYADRSAILHPARPFRPELFAFSSILSNVVVVAGQVCGAWRRQTARDRLRVEVRPLAALTGAEHTLVEAAGARLSRFLGRRVEVVWL